MKKIYLFIFLIFLCFASIAQDYSKTVTVSAGIPIRIKSGTPISASQITLKSTSNRFSSLFLEEALPNSIVVNYDRHVNLVGISGVNGGNDLIAMPVKKLGAVTYSEFLDYSNGTTTNRDILPQHRTIENIYAFGPYANVSRKYINYDAVADGTKELKRATGYRAAAKEVGQTIRFTGTVSTVTETVEITTAGTNRWNLIGNPYPTYLNSQVFLNANIAKLDANAAAIYGYNSGLRSGNGTIGNFTIINRETYTDENIAPGQGFLVANKLGVATAEISFTTAMRLFNGEDDFILGRGENQKKMFRLKASHDTADFATEIYFNAKSTLGLDPGYDAALFDGVSSDFMIYSQLVKDNTGRNMAIQSIGLNDINDVIIPLGLKVQKGKKITFSIENSTLSEETEVYLEDKLSNTFTLLSENDYSFTAENNISGMGRFYIRMENKALSNVDKDISSLKIFASEQTLFINGQLLADTKVSVYDIQGRLVLSSVLKATSEKNTVDARSISSGIYVVKLNNGLQNLTKKVVIK